MELVMAEFQHKHAIDDNGNMRKTPQGIRICPPHAYLTKISKADLQDLLKQLKMCSSPSDFVFLHNLTKIRIVQEERQLGNTDVTLISEEFIIDKE